MPVNALGPLTRPTLLLRLRDPRDREAWTTFVDVYGPLVYHRCRRKGLQDADAADVIQDLFARLVQAIRQFEYRPAKGCFRGWLRQAIDHQIQHVFQQRAGAGRGWGGSAPDGPPDPPARAETTAWEEEFTRHLFRTARARIRPHFEDRTWHAFELLWDQQLSPAAVAVALDMPIDLVYVAKHRVLKQLRQEVEFLAEDSPLAAVSSP
jgi:RNA polymerase sigma-70 factor (ECF subfamily)